MTIKDASHGLFQQGYITVADAESYLESIIKQLEEIGFSQDLRPQTSNLMQSIDVDNVRVLHILGKIHQNIGTAPSFSLRCFLPMGRLSIWDGTGVYGEGSPVITAHHPDEASETFSWEKRSEMERALAIWIMANATPDVAARLKPDESPPTADLQGAATSLEQP